MVPRAAPRTPSSLKNIQKPKEFQRFSEGEGGAIRARKCRQGGPRHLLGSPLALPDPARTTQAGPSSARETPRRAQESPRKPPGRARSSPRDFRCRPEIPEEDPRGTQDPPGARDGAQERRQERPRHPRSFEQGCPERINPAENTRNSPKPAKNTPACAEHKTGKAFRAPVSRSVLNKGSHC